jgi:hypothetical protein
MMTKLFYPVAMIVLLPAAASAEGLLYRLPEDGHWVRFQIDGAAVEADGKQITLVGTVTMSSVGTVEIEGQQHRWIEIVVEAKRAGEPFTDIDKLLIPEQQLAKGKEPLKHVVKAWHKHSMIDGAERQIEDLSGPGARYLKKLNPMLHGPFDAAKELAAVSIDGKLGELDCKGITASEKIEQDGGFTIDSTYSLRLHDKAPFGVVAWEADMKVVQDGQALGTMNSKLKLVDFGNDAKSVIPDAK